MRVIQFYRGRIAALAIAVMVVTLLFTGTAHAAWITYSNLYTLGVPAGITSVAHGTPPLIGAGGNKAAGGQITGYGGSTSGYAHALLWTTSHPNGIDLNPSGFAASEANGTSGTQQVGLGYTTANLYDAQALLWSGSAGSFVDLNPSGFTLSVAYGTNGMQQVGYGWRTATGNQPYALLWNGTAASYVDLNPSGSTSSYAYGTDGTHQVGEVGNHAALWSGTAASHVDLNPSGFDESYAYGTNGTQQVGVGLTGSNDYHALLWSGSAASYVDLNPSGFTDSYAYGTNGTDQVGYGDVGGDQHALLWNNTAASYFDLGALLSASFTNSWATSIDGSTIYGVAEDTSGNYHAIEWNIVPEPGSLGLVGLAMLACALQRRKRGSAPGALNRSNRGTVGAVQ